MAKRKKSSDKDLTFEVLRAALFEKCKELGAASIRIDYDGQGDSGQVEEVCLINAENEEVKTFEHAKAGWFVDGGYVYEAGTLVPVRAGVEEVAIGEALKRYAYDILGKHFPGDWINNEGGYGTICIELTLPPKIILEAHQRVETTDDYVIDVESGETLERRLTSE